MNNNSNNCGDCGTTCSECGRPWAICKQDGGCGCNKCKDIKFCEYGRMANGCIREKQPGCPMQAVIPSVTVESIEGIKNLADCLVHVSDINTTFYIDDKHRPIITWAGPIDIPGYDMEGNPNNYRDQIVTDVANQIAVIYDKSGKGYMFGLVENIDLQEEINNKLDAMAEDGTLQEIIGSYLNANAVWGFETVSEMKVSTNLVDGSFARTLGYYAKNDGGGALYKIRTITNDDVVDEATIIEMGDSSDELVAELIVEDYVTPEMLGAYGDDTHDDTTIFNILFSKFLNIKLGADKTYKITDTLTFPNNVKLEGCGTTSILKSYITNGSPVLQNLTNVSHFIIKNFYIMGNNDNCYGIYVERPYDNCVIEGIYFSDFYKSAIKIGTTSTISQTLVIQNCIVYASQSQALTEPMFDIYKCFECNILNNKLLGHEPSPSNIALLRLNNVYDANIQGNSFAHVAGTGIRINSDSNGSSRNNRIISNTYENITGSYSIELIGTSGYEVSSTIVIEANTYYNAPRLIHCEYESQGTFIGIDSEGGRRNLVIDNNSNKVTEAYQNTFVTADNKTLSMSGIGLQGYDKKLRYRAVVNDSADADYGMQITDKRNAGWKLEIQKGYMGNDLAGNRFKVKSPDGTITKYIGIDNSGNLQAFDNYIS